jgi:hypothetical protein
MKGAGSMLLTVLVLVGVPLGALAVGRETASPAHPASTRAMLERQIRAELKREGVKQVQCGWTSDPSLTVSCDGTRNDGSIEGEQDVVIGQDGR